MTRLFAPGARLALLVAVMACMALPHAASAETAVKKTILVLHTYSQTSPFRSQFDRAFEQHLQQYGLEGADVFVETLESYRFPGDRHAVVFREYLAQKYLHHKVDVIITVWDRALNYVLQNRDHLFPGTPVVALVTRPRTLGSETSVVQVTTSSRVKDTVSLARTFRPNARRLVVVDGTHQSNDDVQMQITDQLKSFGGMLEVEYLRDLPVADVVERIKNVPEDSIILFARQTIRTRTQAMPNMEGLERIAAVARSPIYAVSDQPIGRGALGGFAFRTDRLAELLLARAAHLTSGVRAQDMAIYEAPVFATFDWRQLRRWGISPSQLPAGSDVRFREYTFWEQYRAYIVGAITVILFQAGLIGGLLIQRSRRRRAEGALRVNEQALHVSQEDTRRLAGRLIAAQEVERARIARELHDDLSQKVALLAMDISQVSASEAPGVRRRASVMAERVAEIAADLHNLSHELHPAKLQMLGLVEATQMLCRDIAARHRLEINFRDDSMPSHVPPDEALCLFRIAQEALQNVVKHSGARHVEVNLSGTRESLQLDVTDDGGGFNTTTPGEGIGLLSMRERVNFLDGHLTIRSRPGSGTRVTVRVPLAPSRESAQHETALSA